MRKITGILMLAIVAITACKNKDEFTINGTVKNAGTAKMVMLSETDKVVDSAFINENGNFKFKRVAVDPEFFSLAIGGKNFMVIAQNGDEIEFSADLGDATNTYSISGSEASEKVREFNQLSNKYGGIYSKLEKEYQDQLAVHPQSKDSIYAVLMPEFQRNMDAFALEALKFGNENKDNLAGFYAVGSIDQVKYETQLIKYAEDIKANFPNNNAVKAFVARMERVKPISVGQVAPLFELPSPDGKMIKLADFKGKYVLLDFWASWCGPCRLENPNIVKEYNAFKDKGFTVLSVSLDDDKKKWVDAIAKDKLTWQHVSELQGWEGATSKLYQVEALPSSFMIDPAGKLVAKNLRGIDLGNFLNSHLK